MNVIFTDTKVDNYVVIDDRVFDIEPHVKNVV